MKLLITLAGLATFANAGQLGAHARARLRSGTGAALETDANIEGLSHDLVSSSVVHPTVPPMGKKWNVEPKRCVTGHWRVGCVKDTQFKMRRYYHDFVAKEDRVPMTVEVCWNFCRNVSGAQYFGLERGSKCYCTPTFHSGGEVREEDICATPCEGNPTQMCGGTRQNQDMYQMHDCNNMPSLPCNHPPAAVAHAQLFKSSYYAGALTPCRNAQRSPMETKKNIRCEIVCEEGYWNSENSLECTEMGHRLSYSWAQVIGSAICEPKNCGRPNKIRNAQYPLGDVEYPHNVTYACNLGHSVDGTAQGPKQQDAKCMATGKFSMVTDCLPVRCGVCPTGPKYNNSKPRQQEARVYRDECTYDCATGHTLSEHPDGMKQFSISCLHTGEFAEPPTCKPIKCGAAPAVLHAAATPPRPQGVEEVFQSKVPYTCAPGFSLDRKIAGNTTFELECLADGSFSHSPQCKAVIVGLPPFVNHSKYDNRTYFYGENCTYTCVPGYSMDGKVGGPMTQTLQTGPDATWVGAIPTCLPVECGALPTVAHAKPVSPPAGAINFAAPPVTYACDAGYSTSAIDDIWSPNKAEFYVACKADGTFSTKECVNINDCATRNCGEHGTCEDLPNPTANLLDNYDCKCDSGYMITLHNSSLMAGQLMKRCTNINDCPPDACGGKNSKNLERGLCQDGINTYECSCGAGYEVTTVAGNQTCTPISCGTLAPHGNATYAPATVTGTTVNYDTPEWAVDCLQGYSFDGMAGGPRTEPMRCTSTGTISSAPECVRVSCGSPHFVGNADMNPSPAEMLFGDKVTYTCDEGHALKGDAKGLRVWDITCLDSGTLSKPDTQPGGPPISEQPNTTKPEVQTVDGRIKVTITATTTPVSCLPVICGVVPPQPHATWNATRTYVYGEAAIVDCEDGYSIDGSTSDASGFYKVPCTKDGSFSATAQCQRIRCSAPPTYKYSNYTPVQDPYKYGDKVTYTVGAGYELTLSNGSTINGSFDCYCGSNGKFNETCAMDATVVAINCGPAPSVEHATVTGATHFGGTLLAKADVGYTVDGTATGATNFTFWCEANGRFSPRLAFERIVCGTCPQEANVQQVLMTDAGAALVQLGELLQNSSLSGLKTRQAQDANYAALHAQAHLAATRSGRRLFTTKYGDVVKYVCAEGYRAAPGAGVRSSPVQAVSPTAPSVFELKCGATGDHSLVQASPSDPKCLPVTCDVKAPSATDPAYPPFTEPMKRLQYKDTLAYTCRPGFSLDGTPAGAKAYTETCLATGELSKTATCKDIDWCLVSRCGKNGKCHDGRDSYNCECDPGYKVDIVDSSWQTCANIDECDTLGGYGACSVGAGRCVDGLLGYKCDCVTGYENVKNSVGLDSCAPVLCAALPRKENASSIIEGQKLSYPEMTYFFCHAGYSLDGTVTGQTLFEMSCGADGVLTGTQNECKPVLCPVAPAAPHAKVVGANPVHFGQAVRYECETGASTTGLPSGAANYSVSCLAGGKLGPSQACEPITCGAAPTASFAVSGGQNAEVLFGEKVAYTCVTGFSVDGGAASAKTFDAVCTADGNFSGVQSCKAISCGDLTKDSMKHAQYSLGEYRFPQSIPVVCDTGATVDADPDGESTFHVSCGANGKFANMTDCKPIKCPVPPNPTSHAADKTGEVTYEENVLFTCSTGYSTDGTPIGTKSFSKQCEASGSLSRSSPGSCVDIDFCYDSPCGASGICTDSGAGVPAPGYTCACFEGFEEKPNGLGGTTCSEDDCAGDPCGVGGTCTDLSKVGGGEGAYTCTCEAGYELVEPETMKFTCRRRTCGVLPEVDHTVPIGGQRYLVTTTLGEPKGSLNMSSFERATFECAPGYSTDQRTTPEGMTFSVSCLANGIFSRPISTTSECLPVICEDPYLPFITNAFHISTGVITYGMSAQYACHEGYTINGYVNGTANFTVVCGADGSFPDTNKQCLPVSCPVPQQAHATASRTTLKYSETVSYTCDHGYHLHSSATAHLGFEGVCTANGTVSVDGSVCEPIECGAIPAQPNAMMVGGPQGGMTFGYTATYVCDAGFTLGGIQGGEVLYNIECGSDGYLSGMIGTVPGGPPTGQGVCQLAGYSVDGVVFDAQDPSSKVSDAKVTVLRNGTEIATDYTDSRGRYSVNIPEGTIIIRAEKAGFITREKGPITVTGPMASGGGTSIAMSKILPENDWRIVLTWGKNPDDLDSHVYFGCKEDQHVYYPEENRKGTSERAGGLEVDLDTDDTESYGPETVSIRGAGRCTNPGCCLIKFKVKHYSGSGSLGTSEAVVSVFKGASRVGEYKVPPCIGDAIWWTVLTIDAMNGTNALYEGDKLQPAYLDDSKDAYAKWDLSFDSARWSTAPKTSDNAAVINSLNVQSLTRLHHIAGADYYQLRDGVAAAPSCQEVSFEGLLAQEQWAACPVGTYINGFYRTGSKYDGLAGLEQLTKAMCCTANMGSAAPVDWGLCHIAPITPDPGYKRCGMSAQGRATAMVGLHASKVVNDSARFATYTGDPARSAVTSAGVYLGGNYIELGIRTNTDIGKFGTEETPPAGFHARNFGEPGIGMVSDAKGFANDPSNQLLIDYFLPGVAAEDFMAGYKQSGVTKWCRNCGESVVDTTVAGSNLATATVTNTLGGNLKVVQNVSIGVSDKFFKTIVEVTNVGTSNLDAVRYARTVDADNTVDQFGAFPTIMDIQATYATDGHASVSAKSQPYDEYYTNNNGKQAVLMYISVDPRAKVSFDPDGFLTAVSAYDPYLYDQAMAKGSTQTIDSWMSIAFDFGTLAPGQKAQATFYTALSDATVSEILKTVTEVSEEALTLDNMKCCEVKNGEPIDGPSQCAAP